ncbi:heavy metal translocating P-type ATPase [candidate division KSB1 bacterium]|nr:MAG: heavy metal translocating P-type ATPase [candidate division KSB1 bacterium]
MNNHEHKDFLNSRWYEYPPLRNSLIAGLITTTTFIFLKINIIKPDISPLIFSVAMIISGYHWIREGIEELVEERRISINILMIAAAGGSIILKMWDEAAFLVFLYGAAEGLEEFTYEKTRSAIRKLLDLAPKQARIMKNGKEVLIPAQDIKKGDVFYVRPGESIPTDGVVINGRTTINEAAITGESVPVVKTEGMQIFAASINQQGAITVKATASFEDNMLAKIIHLVEEAQEQKGRVQTFIEKFGQKYTPLVLFSSIMLILIPLLLGLEMDVWIFRAVILLVAAAPCALIMSTPVAIAVGIGSAGKRGVLIKGGGHLENLGKIKVFAFDKTGTLTKGVPEVTDIIAFQGDQKDVLSIAAGIEKLSEHPIAGAIIKKAEQLKLKYAEVTDFMSVTGLGAKAKIGGTVFLSGKLTLFNKQCCEDSIIKKSEELSIQGKTIVFVGTEDKIYGIIALKDEVRDNSRKVISSLHKLGMKVVMLTGDNKNTAESVAKELGIEIVRSDLKPEDKITIIKELSHKYGTCAMVGDGINDAPALAQAEVGIAMGAAGTDAAIEAADIALLSDDLTKVLYAIGLGRKIRKISRQNIIFAVSVLVLLIPSSLAGVLSVAAVVFIHEASELLAVANGLRVGG